jgi:hypothetical protein
VSPLNIKIQKPTSKIDTIPKSQKSDLIKECDTTITLKWDANTNRIWTPHLTISESWMRNIRKIATKTVVLQ